MIPHVCMRFALRIDLFSKSKSDPCRPRCKWWTPVATRYCQLCAWMLTSPTTCDIHTAILRFVIPSLMPFHAASRSASCAFKCFHMITLPLSHVLCSNNSLQCCTGLKQNKTKNWDAADCWSGLQCTLRPSVKCPCHARWQSKCVMLHAQMLWVGADFPEILLRGIQCSMLFINLHWIQRNFAAGLHNQRCPLIA